MVVLPDSVERYLDRLNKLGLGEMERMNPWTVRFIKRDEKYPLETLRVKLSNTNVKVSGRELSKSTRLDKDELAVMLVELSGVKFPKHIPASSMEGLKGKIKGTPYICRDRSVSKDNPTNIILVEDRIEYADGKKEFHPWIMLDDGKWISSWPDELPFWTPDDLPPPETGEIKLMIHEGAKAARETEKIAQDKSSHHPFREFLSEYVHIGMLGGANAARCADWASLVSMNPSKVIYCPDNDVHGRRSVAEVSRFSAGHIKHLQAIRFGDDFPPSFDLADKMPERLFDDNDRTKSYKMTSPRLESLLFPATWATDVVLVGDGKGMKEVVILREEFVSEWVYSIEQNFYVNVNFPNVVLSEDQFNRDQASLSQPGKKLELSSMLQKHIQSKSFTVTYDPSKPSGVYGEGSGILNTYVPGKIKPIEGDPTPIVEFTEHLIPGEIDRNEVLKWCASLVLNAGHRPNYGLLMISEQQGVGKTTLGNILAHLVGFQNYTNIGGDDIEGMWNDWAVMKTFGLCNEVYAGHSKKAYNKLKDIVADDRISVRKKYVNKFDIDNHIMILACSNSMAALKLDNSDRRWYIPKVTEKKYPSKYKSSSDYWTYFHDWLYNKNGLAITLWWFQKNWNVNTWAVEASEAPMSERKKQMQDEIRGPGERIVADAIEQMRELWDAGKLKRTPLILDRDLQYLSSKGDINTDPLYDHSLHLSKIRSIARELGMFVADERTWLPGWGNETKNSTIMSFDESIANTPAKKLCGEDVPDEAKLFPYDIARRHGNKGDPNSGYEGYYFVSKGKLDLGPRPVVVPFKQP